MPHWDVGAQIATGQACGEALAALGHRRGDVVALDGEMPGATCCEPFVQAHPETLRVVGFDLDDTLTVSKPRIDQHMADLLSDLLARLDICIITGGKFEQIRDQVLQDLHAPALVQG